MSEQKLTIEQLLKSMYTLKKEGSANDNKKVLANSLENWTKLGQGDKFRDLFDSDEEAEKAIKDFVAENEYSAIA